MNAARVKELLETLRPADSDITSKIGQRNDYPYLRLETRSPARWAVVSSPGDRWVSLDLDKQFTTNYFDEGMPEEDAVKILSLYAAAATAYVHGDYGVRTSRLFRAPVVVIEVGDVKVEVRRSLEGVLQNIFFKRTMQ